VEIVLPPLKPRFLEADVEGRDPMARCLLLACLLAEREKV
jgi:hypothetical protein